MQIEAYVRLNNKSPFSEWYASLGPQAIAKVATALLRMEMGNVGSIRWFRSIGELKIDWGPGYRVYLLKDGETLIILLGGGTKGSQQRDIGRSIALAAEYKFRKRAGESGLTRYYKV